MHLLQHVSEAVITYWDVQIQSHLGILLQKTAKLAILELTIPFCQRFKCATKARIVRELEFIHLYII